MTPGFHCRFWPIVTEDCWHVNLLSDQDFTDVNGDQYRLPAQATTSDGGSTPRVLWAKFPPVGPEWKAYVLHDGAYRNTLQKLVNGKWSPANLHKQDCDDLLFNALRTLKVSAARAGEIYNAVHWFGHASFAEDRKPT